MAKHAKQTPTKRSSNTRCSATLLLLVLGIVVVFGLLANALFGFFSTGYQSPYTWSNLKWYSSDRPTYTEKGQVASKLGIDVSAYDHDIDWEAVANDGIEFAIIRAGWRGYTEGGLHEDVNFRDNIAGAQEAGLQVGVYLFSSAINEAEAREEALFVISLLREVGVTPSLPVVFDHEPVSSSDGRANGLDTKTASAVANAFCTEIEAAGLKTMIYGNQSDLARYNNSVTAQRPVWFAQYGVSQPTAEFDFSLWQFTSTGTVAGIDRNVDLDIWFTTTIPLP